MATPICGDFGTRGRVVVLDRAAHYSPPGTPEAEIEADRRLCREAGLAIVRDECVTSDGDVMPIGWHVVIGELRVAR